MQYKPITVTVKLEHIERGDPQNGASCAFALALREKFPGFTHVLVAGADELIFETRKGIGFVLRATNDDVNRLNNFIDWFDDRDKLVGPTYKEIWRSEQPENLSFECVIVEEDDSANEYACYIND